MEELRFHPEATENFDRKGESLLSKVKLAVKVPRAVDFHPDVFSQGEVVAKGYVREESTIRGTGETVNIVFSDGQKLVGLFNETCKSLDLLAEQIRKTAQLRDTTNHAFVRKNILDWIEMRVRRETQVSLVDFLIPRIVNSVGKYEIWVPIARLHIETDLRLGKVVFRMISRDVLNNWLADFSGSASAENREALTSWFQAQHQPLQSLAAATISIEAEPSYAMEKALEEAERAVALLRIFHLSASTPMVTCYVLPLGKEHIESFKVYLKRDGEPLQFHDGYSGPRPGPWIISQKDMEEMNGIGLDKLNELFSQEKHSKFQEDLLAALFLYSRSTVAKEPVEKMVFLLVALESFLLKDEREAIQQNIGERMAFVLGQSADERKGIVKTFTDCYDLRSRFLHHGREPEDLEKLTSLMRLTWSFFLRNIRIHDKFSSRKEMFEAIDRIKFSSPT